MKEIHIFDYLKAVWKHRHVSLMIVVSITVGAIGFSFLLRTFYRSQAAIVPIGSSGGGGTGGMASLLSNIAVLGGGGGIASGGSSANFVVFLNSKELRIRVVKALNLIPHFFPNGSGNLSESQIFAQAAVRLGGMVKIENDRIHIQKLIITAEDADSPELATKIVSQYLVELQNFISTNALTQAKRYRLFLEQQLTKNKQDILEMGKALAGFYRTNAISEEKGQLQVPVGLNTNLGVRDFKNYDEFRQHFDVLQKKDSNPEDKASVQYVQNVPHHIYLKYLMTQQQVLEQNYAMLTQSYEMAKMEEAKQEPSFQVLDDPVVPTGKIMPPRRLIAQGAFAVSVFLAILYSLYREYKFPIKNSKLSGRKEESVEQKVPDFEWGRI